MTTPLFSWIAVFGALATLVMPVGAQETKPERADVLRDSAAKTPITVLAGRWGEIGDFGPAAAGPAPEQVLVSLKALRLTDAEVVAGLAPVLAAARAECGAPAPIRILIARFYPPEQAWTTVLAADLEIPSPGGRLVRAGLTFEGHGGNILAPESREGASLVLSEYSLLAS